MVDAEATLAQLMVDGMPDASRFRNAVTLLIERACRGRKDCVIPAYGEMVKYCGRAGHTVAAVRLETLWNQLAQSHAFALLCGYRRATSPRTRLARKSVVSIPRRHRIGRRIPRRCTNDQSHRSRWPVAKRKAIELFRNVSVLRAWAPL